MKTIGLVGGMSWESSMYVRIMENLVEQGAEAVVLGCTEIGLLVREDDCSVPVFDTTRIHAEAAVERAL